MAALSVHSRHALLARGVELSLPLRFSFYESDQTPTHAYFITSGLASIVMTTEDGGTAEIAVVGREGFVGGTALLGPVTEALSAFMQMEGTGVRVPIEDLRAEFLLRGEVYERVLEHAQVQMLTISTFAGCNLLHQAEARLARWLLTADDRTGPQELSLTQEFVGEMLGVRRATVSFTASGLAEQGLISTLRGRVKILDRPRLEQKACDCYRVTRRLQEGLYLHRILPPSTTNGAGHEPSTRGVTPRDE